MLLQKFSYGNAGLSSIVYPRESGFGPVFLLACKSAGAVLAGGFFMMLLA
jgi:hypothetical protein